MKIHFSRALTGAGISSLCIATLMLSAPANAAVASYEIGVPTIPSGGSAYTTLSYGDGTVVTMDYTLLGSGAPGNWTGSLYMDPTADTAGWGGVGDTSTAFAPTSLNGQQGLSLGWNSQSDALLLNCATGPNSSPAGVPTECANHPTITFTFSRPTTDAIFNLHNLAGGEYNGYQTFYSEWNLTSGQSVELVSSVGNFQASGTTISTIHPPTTGITDAVYSTDPRGGSYSGLNATALDVAPQDSRSYYGSGSGAVKVLGTYTSVTFDVTLRYFNNNQMTATSNENGGSPEYVAMNWNVPPAKAELPNTGANATSLGVLGACGLLALALGAFLRRRART